MNPSWQECLYAFYVDGSLRDIFILDITPEDCRTFLSFLLKSEYAVEVLNGTIQTEELPDRFEEFLQPTSEYILTINIDREYLSLNWHLFPADCIVLDLDPKDIHSEQRLRRLLDFIHTVGRLLNKSIVLCPEGAKDIEYFRYDPVSDKDQWFLEGLDENGGWS